MPEPSCHPLGPLLRLEGLDYDEILPVGSSKEQTQAFMTALLAESLHLIGSVDTYYANAGQKRNPSGWKPKGVQTYSGVDAIGGPGEVVVDLLQRGILKPELLAAVNATRADKKSSVTSETWACRRSFHEDVMGAGTASWNEFMVLMKDLHLETERDMTPTVPRAQKVMKWNAAPLVHSVDVPGFEAEGPWTGFTLQLVEMEHDLQTPLLHNRVFPVLQMSCLKADKTAFLVVSVPVNHWQAVPPPQDGAGKLADAAGVVIGSYVSVERFRLVPRAAAEHAMPDKKVSTRSRLMETLRNMKPRPRAPAGAATAPSEEAAASAAASFPAEAPPSVLPHGTASLAVATPAVATPAVGAGAAASHDEDEIAPAPHDAAEEQTVVNEDEQPDDATHAGGDTVIEWDMATASHARGSLPLCFQTPVIPKKIAIDVPLFLKYIQVQRNKAASQSQAQQGADASAGSHADGSHADGSQPAGPP